MGNFGQKQTRNTRRTQPNGKRSGMKEAGVFCRNKKASRLRLKLDTCDDERQYELLNWLYLNQLARQAISEDPSLRPALIVSRTPFKTFFRVNLGLPTGSPVRDVSIT